MILIFEHNFEFMPFFKKPNIKTFYFKYINIIYFYSKNKKDKDSFNFF